MCGITGRKQDGNTGRVQLNDHDKVIIYFIGVWDSVAALGTHGKLKMIDDKHVKYHKVQLPSNVTHAYQAMALHELRASFKPVFWVNKPNGHLEQVWFAGAHADVGGGYDDDTTLSDIALKWMQSKVLSASKESSLPLEIHVGAMTRAC